MSLINENHLINALKQKFNITIDWVDKIYIGITLKWDYEQRKVQLSMPNYAPEVLKRIGHIFSGKPEHSSAEHTPINYGSKVQYTKPDDISPILDGKDIKRI